VTAKEYLSQAYRIDQRINSKLEQVATLRELAVKATSTLSDMPHNHMRNASSMENIICKIVGLEDEINTDIDRLVDLKREISGVINSVEKPEYHLLLELRYQNYKTWEEIAEMMDYSWRNIHYIHAKALKAVELDSLFHCFAQST